MSSFRDRAPRIRAQVHARDGGDCFYCGKVTRLYKLKAKAPVGGLPEDCATLEHLLDRSKGGSNQQNNLVIACHPCNQQRGTLKCTWQEFKAMKGPKPMNNVIATPHLEDGIYFGLDAEIYHAQHRMGSGNVCDMLISPADYWATSWMNPDNQPDEDEEQDEEQTKAQILGTAYHVARLEPDRFESTYWAKPSKKDFPNSLKTDGAIREQLKLLGEPMSKTGENVLERALRLKAAGYPGQILHIEMDKAEAERGERIAIDRKYYDEIVRDMTRFLNSPEIHKHFVGGQSEVTVFWTGKDGVKKKARFDYLKPESWTDFKTFDNARGKVLEQAIVDAIQFNRYYIQAAYYYDAAETIRKGGLKIIGKASDEARDLIDEITSRADPLECWYVFQEKNGIPNLLARRIRLNSDPHQAHEVNAAGAEETIAADVAKLTIKPTALKQKADMEIKHALGLYSFYMEEVGESEPWGPLTPVADIDDDSFNKYWLDGDR